jgi:SOS-response transcriptional repressor LexA
MRGGPRGGARQTETLEFIRAHLRAHGIGPSLDEIASAIGYASKSCAHRVVDKLVRDGRIVRLTNRARGIDLVESEQDHLADCACGRCEERRYLAGLKLVQSLKVEPPVAVRIAFCTNIRPLPNSTRAAFLGSDCRGAAPRTRAAVPRSAK